MFASVQVPVHIVTEGLPPSHSSTAPGNKSISYLTYPNDPHHRGGGASVTPCSLRRDCVHLLIWETTFILLDLLEG